MPVKSTSGSGAYDLFMPQNGEYVPGHFQTLYTLGFSAEVPENHVALILPRSGVGMKANVEINNTCGVIDSDYRGEWFAKIRTKNGSPWNWKAGDRLLQMLIVPVASPELILVDELSDTDRGAGGIGSTGMGSLDKAAAARRDEA
nr:hypothetical protein [uncultured Paraglaciecola sp.]